MARVRLLTFVVLAAASLVAAPFAKAQTKPAPTKQSAQKPEPPVQMSPAKTTLVFEPNRGQFAPNVRWVARGSGFAIAVDADGATIETHQRNGQTPKPSRTAAAQRLSKAAEPKAAIQTGTVKMRLAGSNAWKLEGAKPTGGTSNYFFGKDSKGWHTDIPHYAQAKAAGVYNGVDVVFHGSQSALEYDFVVAPGADPQQIQMKFDGASNLHKDDATGELVMTNTSGKEMRHVLPTIYQETAGKRSGVKGGYEIQKDGTAKFTVGNYDRTKPLVIDPTVSFVKFLIGSDLDEASAVTVDAVGNSYVTGHTESSDFPQIASYEGHQSGDDVFVTKLDSMGNILFSTFLGGGDTDTGQGIAVDATGVYITGYTKSDDFPMRQALQNSRNGDQDAFVAKLSLLGNSLVYSTFLGGSDGEQGIGIAVDASQSAYVSGYTTSGDFPLKNQFQVAYPGPDLVSGFISKLSPSGEYLEYSTYLPGVSFTYVSTIAVDKNLSAYVTGETCANNFPYAGYQSQTFPGNCTAFVTKMSPAGDSVIYSTYLGTQTTEGFGIAVDASGDAYVAGSVEGTDTKTIQAFAMKLNATGKVVYTKLLNGDDGNSIAEGIAIDGSGNAYIVGNTSSSDFPGAPVLTPNPTAGFITELDTNGNGPIFTRLFGASVNGVAVSTIRPNPILPPITNMYLAGYRFTGGHNSNDEDAFVVRLTNQLVVGNQP